MRRLVVALFAAEAYETFPASRAGSALRMTLAAFLALGAPLAPATITVSGGCTLIDAITAANTDTATGSCPAGSGADEIHLTGDIELATVNNSTNGPNGLPSVTSEITIEGGGNTVARSSAGGTPAFRIFHIGYDPSPPYPGGELVLNEVTVSHGRVTDVSGGGIFNDGVLVLTNSTVSGNSVENTVGGSVYGGGIYNRGFYSTGVLTIIDSTISGNTASGGTGVASGGGIASFFGTLSLISSTVSGNIASGLYAYGAGVYSFDYSGSIENSTISSNTNSSTAYDSGSGLWIFPIESFTVTHSTISRNSGTYTDGGGVSSGGSSPPTWTANIIADNYPLNCDTPVNNGGTNFADDASCGAGLGTLTAFDRNLADNGGPTKTHALLTSSSAINAAGMCDLPRDQRGAGRVGTCDSGAFEFIGCADLVLADNTIMTTVTWETCHTARLGPNFGVAAPGELTLTAGALVALGNGVSFGPDVLVEIGIEPSLQTLSPESLALQGRSAP